MFERINEDIKNAMKEKNKDRLEALRFLKSQLIENKTSKAPKDEMDVVIAHIKKLKDSIEAYPAGHAQRAKIETEIGHLQDYLPQALTEPEVQNLIQEILTKLDKPQFGLVMKELSPKIKGKFDGKLATELVKKSIPS